MDSGVPAMGKSVVNCIVRGVLRKLLDNAAPPAYTALR